MKSMTYVPACDRSMQRRSQTEQLIRQEGNAPSMGGVRYVITRQHPDQALRMLFPFPWKEILRWLILCRQFLRRATKDIVTAQHIESSPDVAGGKPRITGHRITVHNVVIWHERMGLNADAIASQHGLSLADVYAALAYYYDHRQAIDEAILADESYVAELRNRTESKLIGKIGG